MATPESSRGGAQRPPPPLWKLDRLPSQAISLSGPSLPVSEPESPGIGPLSPQHSVRTPSVTITDSTQALGAAQPESAATLKLREPPATIMSTASSAASSASYSPSLPAQGASSPSSRLPSPNPSISSSIRTHTPGHRRQYSQPTSPKPVKQTSHGHVFVSPKDGSRSLNGYTLRDTLGKGAFGAVERATDALGSEFAIKEYSKSKLRRNMRNRLRSRRAPAPSPDGLELVKIEVAIMKKLSHPNICRLLEVIDTEPQEDSIFFVMELCKGGPILTPEVGKRVEPLSEADARHVVQQLVLGVEYLHVNEIIHHDIKPDNLLFVSAGPDKLHGEVKIVDFGVSEAFAAPGDDTTHKSAGSPAFLSPELCIAAVGNHGKPADIWAMGVTLYTLVCGYLPWEDTHVLALYSRIKDDPVAIPGYLSDELQDLLAKLLTKDPSHRIRMEELRVHPWLTNSGEEPLPSTHDNVTPVDDPSPAEIASAISTYSFGTLSQVVRAISKFKAGRNRARRRGTNSSLGSATSAGSPAGLGIWGSFGSHEIVGSPSTSNLDSPSGSTKDSRDLPLLEEIPEIDMNLWGPEEGVMDSFATAWEGEAAMWNSAVREVKEEADAGLAGASSKGKENAEADDDDIPFGGLSVKA